ncbi:MAG: hypothetical protein P8O07_06350 [Crocinitomicaceae bacterium]|nr:hypothetical protein [Crocinitomicaceae bacterium]
MLTAIFKKKLSDDQLSTIFVNGVLDVVDKSFSEVACLIKEDPAFVTPPDLSKANDGHFTMIVIVANLNFLGGSFEADQSVRLEKLIITKFSEIFEVEEGQFKNYLTEYRNFISRVNHPSKNMIYGMSKAIFHKYKLNEYQDDYFRSMDCPNPLFLKRMDEVVVNFIWNWEAFFKRYKMVG